MRRNYAGEAEQQQPASVACERSREEDRSHSSRCRQGSIMTSEFTGVCHETSSVALGKHLVQMGLGETGKQSRRQPVQTFCEGRLLCKEHGGGMTK